MGNNDLNHRILLSSASFHCEPLKVAQYEQNKNLSLSCPAQFSRISLQIFRSYGISFLVFSFFCCLEKAVTFVAYHDKSCDQNRYSVEQANQARSAKFEKTGIVMSFFNIVSRVTYEKYANLG